MAKPPRSDACGYPNVALLKRGRSVVDPMNGNRKNSRYDNLSSLCPMAIQVIKNKYKARTGTDWQMMISWRFRRLEKMVGQKRAYRLCSLFMSTISVRQMVAPIHQWLPAKMASLSC